MSFPDFLFYFIFAKRSHTKFAGFAFACFIPYFFWWATSCSSEVDTVKTRRERQVVCDRVEVQTEPWESLKQPVELHQAKHYIPPS